MPELRIPLATYRIQFSLGFRFVDGRDLVPYLNDLGITDLYSSPRFKARRGSAHAYDVADPLKINSELGTEEEFAELAQKLKAYGMGLVLDIVPNHMAASAENPWWMDVLENGRNSIYAHHFAIDWERTCFKSTGTSKVVLPILGELYGTVLHNGQFSLKLDENGFFVKYFEHRLPLDPKSYRLIFESGRAGTMPEAAEILAAFDALPSGRLDAAGRQERHRLKTGLKERLWKLYSENPELKTALDECLITIGGAPGDAASFDTLDRILAAQSYRVAYWRMAGEDLNYRRFFDITDLIGIRVEDPDVFQSRHPEIVGLANVGGVTGMRIDHIDGLWDPRGYLERLKSLVLASEGEAGCTGFYIIVEKILGSSEQAPAEWGICGTTGYDFLAYLNGLFIDPEGLCKLDGIYRRATGITEDFAQIRYLRKRQVMDELFRGEVRALGFHLGRLAAQDRFARDLPFADLEKAMVEVIAWFPVYRTYTRDFEIAPRDRERIEHALEMARATTPAADPGVLDFLRRVLLLEIPHYIESREPWLNFVMAWQQFTGPVMAKGYEDTACYYYNRLISSNEVGSDPESADHPGGVEGFHRRNAERLAAWPHTMNATSTHDTKRSEDVRARINVLAEIPDMWGRRLASWSSWNESKKQMVDGALAPDRNDEVLLYESLIGAWPLGEEDRSGLRERLKAFMQKAVREAKTRSHWLRPNEEYENACAAFVDALLDESVGNAFLKDFIAFHRRIAAPGAVNALAQVLLKIASPGLPDFYQGTELWDFSLVDPDNRRPVDFTRRAALLDELRRREAQDLPGLLRDLTANWEDGRIKLYLTYKALNFRKAQPELFQKGEYLPVEAPHACAFARRAGDRWALVVVPRMVARLSEPRKRLLRAGVFGDAAVEVPEQAPSVWRNVLTGEEIRTPRLAGLFASFPVALLEGQ
ncbi:MAG TPA: malto-oligosyltrehalose synthase [Bryobacteraceae bacterium]|nr:malto-oligosyltrehalose synthase [Bryobacteraceae bacterium]